MCCTSFCNALVLSSNRFRMSVIKLPAFLLHFLLGVFSFKSVRTVRTSSVKLGVRFLVAPGVSFPAVLFSSSGASSASACHSGACSDPSRNCSSISSILLFVPVVGCCSAHLSLSDICYRHFTYVRMYIVYIILRVLIIVSTQHTYASRYTLIGSPAANSHCAG